MEPIKIQKVIDYIEAHLTEELSYKQFAAMVAVSEADLQRSFKMIMLELTCCMTRFG